MLIVVMAANVRCRGMKSAARGVRDGRREIATIVRFRSCFSYVAVESGSQFGGGRLLVAGKDRDVVGRYSEVRSSFDAGSCRRRQGGSR
jgi:hypothetical protein